MLGAIVGDFVGSRFEFKPIKTKEFDLVHEACIYTDDSVLTIAVAEALANDLNMADTLRRHTVENVTSYGPAYWGWANGWIGPGPYGSWGNGASMRVSPAAWFAHSSFECLFRAWASAAVSHDHPEGIRGAQAVALSIYAAMSGWPQADIRKLIEDKFGYDLSKSVDEIRPISEFELKSWISVPRAIVCALEATSFEDAVRNAVSLGGDADTEAAIAGSIAEAIFGVPEELKEAAVKVLPNGLRRILADVIEQSSKVVRKPLSSEDVDEIPTWDPTCVERWNAERQPETTPIVYEPDPWKFEDEFAPQQSFMTRILSPIRRMFGVRQ